MKIYLSMLVALLPIVAGADPEESEPPPDAKAIIQKVKSQFPAEPVSISGTITVRRRRGVVVKEMGYAMNAKWTRDGGTMRCVFSDSLGREANTVHISFKHGDEPEIKREGEGLVDDKGIVAGTALDCGDLTMPFLWWETSELIDTEKDRGRECYVLELKPKEAGEVSRVKAWIDSKIFIVLKAESYGKDDKLLKQITVKSFKKVDDQWMIKDLEVISSSSPNKTVVTVEDMAVEKKLGGRTEN